MKKLFILTVVFVLQLVLTSSFACELRVSENMGNLTSRAKFSKIEKIKSFSNLSTKDQSSDHSTGDLFHCDHCEGCNHFLISLNVIFSFQEFNSYFSANFFYDHIYTQPDISFLSKPPIHV